MALQEPPPLVIAPIDPPPAPRTYRELYANHLNDNVFAHPAEYLAGYRFVDAAGNAPGPAALRDLTLQLCDRQPMAFLALVPRVDGTPEVRIVHRFMRYTDLPGEPPTGFNERVLGLLGDIQPMQFPLVEVPNDTAFHLITAQVRVPVLVAMAGIIAAWDDRLDPYLGPYNDGDLGTELVRPRNLQLLPSRYAALLVNRDAVTPKQAYTELAAALTTDGNLAACVDMLTWLRAACTARPAAAGGGGGAAQSPVLYTLRPIIAPERVSRFVASKIMGDLPVLRNPAVYGQPAPMAPPLLAADLAGLVQNLAQAQRNAGMERRAQEREPKTIQEAYREIYPLLLRHCRVEDPLDVPMVWNRLANAQKGEYYTILNQECLAVCRTRGWAPELYTPVITTTLRQAILAHQFAGTSTDDLATGCNPFLVVYSGATDNARAQEAATLGQQLELGSHNVTLADVQTIKAKERVRFPTDIYQVGITLIRYAVLMQTLLQGVGPPHPYVQAVWDLATKFHQRQPFIVERYLEASRLGPYSTYPARILRYVQVQGEEYFQAIAAATAGFQAVDAVPNFTPLLLHLQHGTFQHSSEWYPIPAIYLVQGPNTLPTSSAGGMINSTPQAAAYAPGGSSRSPTSSGTDPSAGARSNDRIPNPTVDAEFAALTLKPRIRNLLRLHQPPANGAGHPMCVSWWCKGGCYPNCSRRLAHVPFANTQERGKLLRFVKDYLVAPPATTNNTQA
jgi:hypothetical protein